MVRLCRYHSSRRIARNKAAWGEKCLGRLDMCNMCNVCNFHNLHKKTQICAFCTFTCALCSFDTLVPIGTAWHQCRPPTRPSRQRTGAQSRGERAVWCVHHMIGLVSAEFSAALKQRDGNDRGFTYNRFCLYLCARSLSAWQRRVCSSSHFFPTYLLQVLAFRIYFVPTSARHDFQLFECQTNDSISNVFVRHPTGH